jgi:A/G-specific adenine glycosylase
VTVATSPATAGGKSDHLDRRDAIAAWAATETEEREKLPWRGTRDPWAVLLSELMLAQTQVARVAERFPDLLRRFPTPKACAEAALGDVVVAWSGLGYNRRAVALWRCAGAIVELHRGEVPRTLGELLALPGVGPYTARAVLAFAFDEPVGVVDVNIRRSLLRAFSGGTIPPAEVQTLADHLVEGVGSRRWNLALMDFGATICRARNPKCSSCPLSSRCAWRLSGKEADPGARHVRQSRFVGSDREGRSRLLTAAFSGPVAISEAAAAAGWPDNPERAKRMLDELAADGLLVVGPATFCLP